MTGQTMIERREWSQLRERWPRRQVLVASLNIDRSYQREVVSTHRARIIARAWDFAAAGYIVVCQREDGSLWVIDGQHRVEAARLRGDIHKLDAIVCSLATVAEEAALFRLLNTSPARVASMDLFKATLMAGDAAHVECNAMLARAGLRVGSGKGAEDVRFPKCLMRTFRADPSVCESALVVQRRMIGTEAQLAERIHIGLCGVVARHGFEVVWERAAGVLAHGGRDAVLCEIRRQMLQRGYACHNTTMACTSGVLAVLNHGRHRKLTLE